MSSQVIKKQARYTYIPQIIILFLYSYIFSLFEIKEPVIMAAVTYIILSLTLRIIIPIHHRRGYRLYKLEQYEEAIVHFQRSYDFFQKYRFFDQYRYLLMLSRNDITYLETSLLNMAFCHEQTGNYQKAKELYIKALSLFPDNQIAKDALKLMNDMKRV